MPGDDRGNASNHAISWYLELSSVKEITKIVEYIKYGWINKTPRPVSLKNVSAVKHMQKIGSKEHGGAGEAPPAAACKPAVLICC